MRTSYEAVVIGSGFGGSVAACRLAQAGRSVVVLERGRRYDTNPFPRDWNNPADGWLWPIRQGLFDLKHFSQMMVIEAAGLGGGSLIYANVQLRAHHGVANAHGEVFGYPGMFVLDGAAIPVAIGANPSHTITAVAERNIEAVIRRIVNDPNWHAPEAPAPSIEDPLSNVVIPPEGVPPL